MPLPELIPRSTDSCSEGSRGETGRNNASGGSGPRERRQNEITLEVFEEERRRSGHHSGDED